MAFPMTLTVFQVIKFLPELLYYNVHQCCPGCYMLSEEMVHRVTWGQFVNWNCGQGIMSIL